jgi:hypothetical protein
LFLHLGTLCFRTLLSAAVEIGTYPLAHLAATEATAGTSTGTSEAASTRTTPAGTAKASATGTSATGASEASAGTAFRTRSATLCSTAVRLTASLFQVQLINLIILCVCQAQHLLHMIRGTSGLLFRRYGCTVPPLLGSRSLGTSLLRPHRGTAPQSSGTNE